MPVNADPEQRTVFSMNLDWTVWREVTAGAGDRAGLAGHNWVDSQVYPDDRTRVSVILAQAIAAREVFESHHRLSTDGRRHVSLRALPLLGDDGEIIEWLCVVSAPAASPTPRG
jgi:hypothetical protein